MLGVLLLFLWEDVEESSLLLLLLLWSLIRRDDFLDGGDLGSIVLILLIIDGLLDTHLLVLVALIDYFDLIITGKFCLIYLDEDSLFIFILLLCLLLLKNPLLKVS